MNRYTNRADGEVGLRWLSPNLKQVIMTQIKMLSLKVKVLCCGSRGFGMHDWSKYFTMKSVYSMLRHYLLKKQKLQDAKQVWEKRWHKTRTNTGFVFPRWKSVMTEKYFHYVCRNFWSKTFQDFSFSIKFHLHWMPPTQQLFSSTIRTWLQKWKTNGLLLWMFSVIKLRRGFNCFLGKIY